VWVGRRIKPSKASSPAPIHILEYPCVILTMIFKVRLSL
jgi:hypothetical protein